MSKQSKTSSGKPETDDSLPASENTEAIHQKVSGLSEDERKQLENKILKKHQDSQPVTEICRSAELQAPLSSTQQRLWFLDQLYPGSTQYIQQRAWRMHGLLSPDCLERSLQAIAERHHVLSMRVITKKGIPYQQIETDKPIQLAIFDLEKTPAGEREAQCRQRINEVMKTPVKLSTGPLFSAQLYRLDDNMHVLLTRIHHIVTDGWSFNLFKKELSACYNAFLRNETPSLAGLPVQFGDYARYQEAWLTGNQFEKLTAYWKQQLSGNITPHGITTDLPRPPAQSDKGAHLPFSFTRSLSEKILSASQQLRVTPFILLTAGLNLLIHRYSGNEDIFIGTAIANRTLVEVENLIGFFANTLVLRTDLSGDPDFSELVRRTCEVALDAYTHQDMPFEVLVAELKPERDLSRTPLFQISIVYQNTPASELQLDGLEANAYALENTTSKFDMTLQLVSKNGIISGYWEYCTDLFYPSTIERLSSLYQLLLEQALAEPDRPVSKLQILTADKYDHFRNDWNNTDRDYAEARCVHQIFEAQASATPAALALSEGDRHLSYAELNARANQLAHHLRERGAGTNVLIGLSTRRSIDAVIGILGILKSGAAYVPIDPAYPEERQQYILQEVSSANNGSPILLTQQALANRFAFFSGQLICLDSPSGEISDQPASNPDNTSRLEHSAYVIYTSGSTGNPKGVCVPHRALQHYLVWAIDFFTREHTVVAPLFTSISFDLTITCLYTPLLSGGRLVVYPEQEKNDNLSILDVIDDNQVNFIKLTPSHLALISGMDLQECRIRTLISAGEELRTGLAMKITESLDNRVRLYNSYGPTETTVNCMQHLYSPDEDLGDSVPIGQPIANTKIYILDPKLQPVPVGVPGELHIGGNGLSNGYLNQPEMTSEKFIPDPFCDGQGNLLYKSGDTARYQQDGSIVFLGRMDSQINLRGYRIEPGEIESALLSHPDVTRALVRADSSHESDVRLLAYVTLKGDTKASQTELHNFLTEKLPAYMIPELILPIDTFPLTVNGKIDTRALPVPERRHTGPADTREEPLSPVETVLTEIWQEVLGTHSLGIHDDLFELGAHSLLIAHAANRINDTFNTNLQLRCFFEAPSIATLAERITGELLALTEDGEMDQRPHVQPDTPGSRG